MKKTTTLLTFILFFVATVFADPVDPDKALEIANSFWRGNSLSGKKAVTLQLAPNDAMAKSGSRLTIDLLSHNVVGLAVTNDEELTVVKDLLGNLFIA